MKYDIPLTVAAYIYDCQVKGERVWFRKLVENLPYDRNEVSQALDDLFDLYIIYGYYGEIPGNKATRLYKLWNCVIPIIEPIWRELYA